MYNKLNKQAELYNKLSQVAIPEVEIIGENNVNNYSETIQNVAEAVLESLRMPQAYIVVRTTGPKTYSIEVNAEHYYNQDGDWVRPSDIFSYIQGALQQQFTDQPDMVFNVSVPFSADKM